MSIINLLKRLYRLRIVVLVLLTLALTLGLTITLPVKLQAQSEPPSLSSLIPEQWDVIPTTDLPYMNREVGRTRCTCILRANLETPLILVPLSGIGTTVADYPTLFWYIPKSQAWGIELSWRDSNDEEVYSTKYAFTHYTEEGFNGYEQHIAVGTPGIMSFTLPGVATQPSLLPPLEIGQKYHWILVIICEPKDAGSHKYIGGVVERVQLNPLDERFLAQATSEERLAFYVKKRIWYETVATLMQLRRERPDDQDVVNAWNKLLKSIGFEEYSFLTGV